ncbi:MAG: DUF1385 domain-containing protein [Acutalibacteraceae bacterium]|nr:DUF1385 domain-containing protein [Acutalibacteraceae bacterium]
MGESRKEHIKKITSIGGSALIEGIMMRGPKKTMVAVRTGENEIYTEEVEFSGLGSKGEFFRLPLVRGVVGMIDSMRLSYKALMISADKAIESIPEDEQEEPSKFEKWLDDHMGEKFLNVFMTISMIIGVLIAIVLFYWAPTKLYNVITEALGGVDGMSWIGDRFFRSLFEGVIRIGLFLLYIIACTRMSDMKRVFQYHGAEHKTIYCYESDEELTVENVKKHTRFHPRCGTSFLVIMLLVGIVIGLFIPISTPWLRTAVKLLLLPVSCGIGYELIKLCGRHDNKLTRIIAAPGLWAQRITTKEPTNDMIEVAIKAMKAVIPENGEDIISSSDND